MKQIRTFLILILISGFLLSCSSQNQASTNTPAKPNTLNSETAEPVLVENTTPNTSGSLDDTTVAIESDSEKDKTPYNLDWKIADNEIVAYKTAMNPIDRADSSISINFDQSFTGNDIPNEVRGLLRSIKLPGVFSMISILEKNPHGNISVKMIVDEIETSENEEDNVLSEGFNQLIGAMKGTVQLRGELTPNGSISSFYLEQKQRNLLAMFFELPTDAVYVGDSWEIDVNCISMGNGFSAKNAERINRVEFTELTQNADGKPVAILDYVIMEIVEGDFESPLSDEAIPASMTCAFLGQGVFLIEEGRWERFVGEFAIKGTGIMEADAVQHFALTPLKDIPEEYIDLK